MPRVVYTSGFLTEANKTNISPQVVGMVELSNNAFAVGSVIGHTTYPLPAPYNYGGRLRDVSSLDFSLNGSVGRVSFSISNADLAEVANVANDNYIGWECKVHKILILDNGSVTGILLLHGVVTSYTMTDQVVSMDVTTRINVTNSINNRRVGKKCGWVFKGTECGYNGNLTTCNKLYVSNDGCSGRSNQHRFGGFPDRDTIASLGVVSGQGQTPGYMLSETFSEQVITANTTVVATDLRYLKCNHTSPITITLPSPATFPDNGQPITIKDCSTAGASTNNITIQSAGGGTVNGATFAITSSKGAVTLSADKSSGDWRIVADYNSTPSSGSGTVTSVALTAPSFLTVAGSPITTSGTLALSLATQNVNTVLAGPSAGGAAVPTFRTLALADLPFDGYTGDGYTGSNFVVVIQDTPLIITPRIGEIRTATSPFRAVLTFGQAANSANYVRITNSATGSGLGPIIESVGTGTDVDLKLKSKGMGSVEATANLVSIKNITSTSPGILAIQGGTASFSGGQVLLGSNTGTTFTGFVAPDSLASDVYYTLPLADGTSGQFLSTNGSGVLSWATASGGSITDGDKGDITVSSSGTIWTIDNSAVTFAKIQDIATDRILGRVTAGSGPVEEITPGGGILTWLQTPSSANLASAVTDETGSGKLVFSVNPELETPYIDSIRAWVSPSTLGGRVLRFTHSSGGGSNCVEIVNAANSGTPIIRAFGFSDINVPLRLSAKGNSSVIVTASSFRVEGSTVSGVTDPGIIEARGGNQISGGGKIHLYERSTNGNNYVGFEAPDSLASDLFWTLPATDGTVNQALVTDGGAGLYWKSFEVPLTFSTGLTRTTNTITVNTTQNIVRLSNLTTNGFVKATNADGTLSVDTNTYLTGNQTVTLSGDVTGSGATSIPATIANDAVTFAKMQNVTSGVLLGRTTASTGDIEQITPGGGILAWLQDATSAKLATAVTDETGSGLLVFNTSPTLVTPRINLIHTAGSPSNPVLGFEQVASSVNYLQISNAASGTSPVLEAVGTSSNIGVIVRAKNLEQIRLLSDSGISIEPVSMGAGFYGSIDVRGGTTAGDGGAIAVRNPGNSGYVGFLAPDTISTSVLYTLPSSDGTNGQVLRTNGSGVLSWVAPVTDGDKGDITVSGSGGTWTIDNNAVTFSKFQVINRLRLIGRGTISGSGDAQEIQLASPLAFNSATLTFSEQNAHHVFAGPVGSIGPPTFRLLSASDIPDLSNLYLSVNTYIPPGEQYFGTVTSIGMTVPSFLSVTPSTITSSGTFAISLVNQNANLVFAGPASGTPQPPTFRSLVAADIPDLSSTYLTGNQTITLSGDVSGSGATSITTTIANNVVTFAKFQNITSGRIIGRTTPSSGSVEEISIGSGLSLSSGVLSSTSSGGTVTSVALTVPAFLSLSGSPITTSGTIAITIPNANANAVFAGPLSGLAAQPAFRSLVLADLPTINTNRLLGRVSGSSGVVEEITPGAGVLDWLQDPTSAKLATAVTGETGSGELVFGTSPSFTNSATFADNAEVRFAELATNGSNYVGFKANISLSANTIWTLPSVDGSNGQVLSTNGGGLLSWTTVTSGAGVTDGDKGDVIVSASGATWTIDDSVVTLAKMANLTADRVIGRSGTTGAPQELTLSQVLEFGGPAAQGDILYRDASTWTRLSAGTSGRLLQTKGTGANPVWALDAMATSTISPTTAATTGVVNTRYFANISGLTANRDFTLPAGAAGDRVEITITTGDDTFALIVKGASGVSINGGAAAAEWSRLLIAGETVTFIATSSSNWQVLVDGRISCTARLGYTGAQYAILNATNTQITFNAVTFDNTTPSPGTGGIAKVAPANGLVLRRSGKYLISAAFRYDAFAANTARVGFYLAKNSVAIPLQVVEGYAANGTVAGSAIATFASLVAGDGILAVTYQFSGNNVNTLDVAVAPDPIHLECVEIFT